MDLTTQFRLVTNNRQEYLEAKSIPDPNSGCWLWLGSVNEHNYGRVIYKGKRIYAHRHSWEAFNGEIPEGLKVLHKCDNPLCINPDHLFLGTQSDNMKDKVSKNRQHRLKGEDHGQSTLTDKDVLEIRNKYIPRKYTAKILSKEYNTSIQNIRSILYRRSWRHLNEN